MKRRGFLKSIPLVTAPLALGGIPVNLLADAKINSQLSTCENLNDRVVVLIRLAGGNDSVNMFVPYNQYDAYAGYRPNIRIPENQLTLLDSTLSDQENIYLHPDIMDFKSMYEDGNAHVIHSVNYANNNKSHFKATDIWMTGTDADPANETFSGWTGRYLNTRFAGYPVGYPNTDMPDPPGLELGSRNLSLTFHRNEASPIGLAMNGDPESFYDLVSSVGGAQPETIPDNLYGDELQYLIDIENSSNGYAQRITDVYNNGTNAVTYPSQYDGTISTSTRTNELSAQLKTVARLISGGSKTKVFLVKIGGFDTHVNQVEAGATQTGIHGVLIHNLFAAVKAFQDDLEAQGLADRVMSVTFSEFGRKVRENGNNGTDHGTLAPMMVFGKRVNAGVTGTYEDMAVLSNGGSGDNFQSYQHDYRQVFTTLLQDWLGASDATLSDATLAAFSTQKMGLIESDFVVDPSCYDVLPVTMSHFDARAERNRQVRLDWVTESELNNDFFAVERSKDSIHFEEIGTVRGAGSSSTRKKYTYLDEAPYHGVSYYRLRQVDYDGNFTYTDTKAVEIDSERQISIKTYPNPVIDKVNIKVLTEMHGRVDLNLFSVTGQLVKQQQANVTKGRNILEMPLHDLAPAIYNLRISTPQGDHLSQRVVVAR